MLRREDECMGAHVMHDAELFNDSFGEEEDDLDESGNIRHQDLKGEEVVNYKTSLQLPVLDLLSAGGVPVQDSRGSFCLRSLGPSTACTNAFLDLRQCQEGHQILPEKSKCGQGRNNSTVAVLRHAERNLRA
jgi:hypothetical protein